MVRPNQSVINLVFQAVPEERRLEGITGLHTSPFHAIASTVQDYEWRMPGFNKHWESELEVKCVEPLQLKDKISFETTYRTWPKSRWLISLYLSARYGTGTKL